MPRLAAHGRGKDLALKACWHMLCTIFVIEDRIEQEFQCAIGGIPTIERMRQDFHERYADYPSLHSFIDRVANDTRRRLLEEAECMNSIRFQDAAIPMQRLGEGLFSEIVA